MIVRGIAPLLTIQASGVGVQGSGQRHGQSVDEKTGASLCSAPATRTPNPNWLRSIAGDAVGRTIVNGDLD